ncbi:MAG: ankyrin repeat domain-containing protein [Simkaniaceae bacterium]|nr:ankyrin repeat domain-containing protein [Simkaniaceae bacterium]
MRAAGRPGPDWKPLEITKNPSKRGHIFDPEKVEKGHLAHDTLANIELIERAGAHRENWQGTDVNGNDIYLFNNPDGTQAWAEARVVEGEGYRIVAGGISLPGKHARFNHHLGRNETLFQGRVARLANNAASRVFGPWRDGGGASRSNNPPSKGNQPKGWDVHSFKGHLALSSFRQLLQQTNLVGSYNSSHPHNMMPHKGVVSGEIGGVACSSTYITGLFDGVESLVEDHFFAVPMLSDGGMPFSNSELKQIMRELAIGIYVHSAVPFFSLHFREEGSDLFPVIHPAYQNTLVGRIIGMLDYFMKGYLNGGVYTEEFIDRWHEHADWSGGEASVLPSLIDFTSYCKTHMEGSDKQYISLATLHGLVDDDPTIQEDLKSFRGFKNSFRIIAKQNSVQKGGNLFVLDGDFDVLYDIVPSPKYKLALEAYTRKFGHPPKSYAKLQELYGVIARRIHDHMAKMPLCRQYFALLNVISFFSGYFSTLKKHRKVPSLTRMEVPPAPGCPPLFPHLPVSVKKTESLKINTYKVLNGALLSHRDEFVDYFKSFYLHLVGNNSDEFISPGRERLIQILKNQFFENMFASSSPPVRRYFQINMDQLSIGALANGLHQALCHSFKQRYRQSIENPLLNIFLFQPISQGFASEFLNEIRSRSPDVDRDFFIVSVPFTYLPKEIDASTRSKVEKVVGGCGLSLEKHRVVPSLTAEGILHRHSEKLFSTPSETIQVVSDAGGNEHAVFRLFMEDLPPHIIEDFSWMEDSLLVRPHESYEMLESRLDIQEAMLSDEKESFVRLMDSTPYVRELVDRDGRNLLHMAALLSDPFFIEAFLSRGCSPEDKDLGGYTPLHYAVMTGSIVVAERLLTMANINAAAKNGATPLIVAIQHKQEKAVELLLSRGARFTLMAEGYSTLHCALHEGHLGIIFAVLSSPFARDFINTICIEGGGPLVLAAELDNREVVAHLLDLGADPRYARADGVTPMEIAIRRNCMPVVDILLTKTVLSPLAIHAAAETGDEHMIEKLLPHLYSYKNSSKDNALHIMLRSGNTFSAIKMIEKCTDLSVLTARNIEGESPADTAIILNLWGVIAALIEKSIPIDPRQLLVMEYNPLLKELFEKAALPLAELERAALVAAQVGNYQALTYIFDRSGVNLLEIRGPKGWGILHYLAKSDGVFLFRRYLARTDDLRQALPEDGHRTLAAIAAEFGSRRVLTALLSAMKSKGVPLDGAFGPKHLMLIAIENNVDDILFEEFEPEALVSTLLDENGSMAAHVAAKWGNSKALIRISLAGGNLEAVDAHGLTPLTYASRLGDSESIAFLLSKHVPVTPKALYFAASHPQDDHLKLMIMNNRSAEVLDESLMEAIRNYDFEAVFRLRAFNASLRHISADGKTPTFLASLTGQEDILQFILRYEPKDQRLVGDKSPLIAAVESKSAACIALLLSSGHRDVPNRGGLTAAAIGGTDMASAFTSGPDPISLQFVEALSRDDVEGMEAVIGSNPINGVISIDMGNGKKRGTPLQLLVGETQDHEVRKVISKFLGHPNLDANRQDNKGNTLAHVLLEKNISPVHLRGVDFSIMNHQGVAPVHIAAHMATDEVFSEVVVFLREMGRLDLLELPDHKGRTPIFYAIGGLKHHNIECLIELGVDLNHSDHSLMSPLAKACMMHELFIVKKLLVSGANPNQRITAKRITALNLCLATKNHMMIWHLLASGANPKIADQDGDYPIHQAAEAGLDSIISLFNSSGMPLTIKNHMGIEPKYAAALGGKTSTLSRILDLTFGGINDTVGKFSTVKDKEENLPREATLLHLACLAGHPETARWLLAKGANPEAQSEKAPSVLDFVAASEGSSALLPLFEKYRILKEPEPLRKAIISAIIHDNLDAAKFLYRKGLTINEELIDGYTGLHFASQTGALQCTAWLLLNGADVAFESRSRQTPIGLSAGNASLRQFGLMLEDARVDLHQINIQGETLAHLAAKAGNIGHLALLIRRCIRLDEQDNNGRTALHLAARAGHGNVIKFLLICGASPCVRDIRDKLWEDYIDPKDTATLEVMELCKRLLAAPVEGQTSLHLAVKSNFPDAVKLLAQTPDLDLINAKDANGDTALHLAVKQGQQIDIMNLLQAGASVHIVDNEGKDPLQSAYLPHPRVDIIRMLVGAGASLEPRTAFVAERGPSGSFPDDAGSSGCSTM